MKNRHPTVRAADGATPRGDWRGKNSEKSSPSVVLDGAAPPLTLLLGAGEEKWKAQR